MTEISTSSSITNSMFSSCEFSEPITATSSLFSTPSLSSSINNLTTSSESKASINSQVLFSVSGTRLTVRDGSTLQVIQVYNCVDKIDCIRLSPDKQYILCAMYARGVIEIFSLEDPEWSCKINERVGAGLISAGWTPDSRHIISQSDFGIHLCIWNLVDSTSVIISSPKHLISADSVSNGAMHQSYAFSDCGRYLALLHRLELQDYIAVYATGPWEELAKFRCQTSDACCIQWLPHGLHIVVSDSPLSYKLVVYTPGGQLISSLEAYEHALGIRRVNFQPSSTSSMMAVASFDGKIRLLSTRSWQVAFLVSCTHPKDMESTTLPNKENAERNASYTGDQYMLVEESNWLGHNAATDDHSIAADMSMSMNATLKSFSSKAATHRGASRHPSSYSAKLLKNLPHNTIDPLKSKGHIAMGVNWTDFSPNGDLIAGRDDAYPRCLWIWTMADVKLLHVIVQLDNIVDSAWRPSTSGVSAPAILALCCGSSRVYFWSMRTGVSWSDIPASLAPFSVTSIQWSQDGSQLILAGKEVFCTCALNVDAEGSSFSTIINA